MLLALDNAEHLLAGVAHVPRSHADAAPGLRLLVTSQAPLRLAAERVLRIGPLAVPRESRCPRSRRCASARWRLFADARAGGRRSASR